MRYAVYGASLLALTFTLPALADCADDIAMVEQELDAGVAPAAGEGAAAAPKDEADEAAAAQERETAAGESSEANPGESPEEVVDEMVEEGVEVEEAGQKTKFAAGGHAEPRETWQSGDNSPEEHPAVVHLTSAKEHLEGGDEQGCLDEVGKARDALASEQDG
jgi:hypothetical protein